MEPQKIAVGIGDDDLAVALFAVPGAIPAFFQRQEQRLVVTLKRGQHGGQGADADLQVYAAPEGAFQRTGVKGAPQAGLVQHQLGPLAPQKDEPLVRAFPGDGELQQAAIEIAADAPVADREFGNQGRAHPAALGRR
ncbi:hypothetical protein [Oceaniglobus trochenteri]|uniref:hypothetical protein n=1 Tax=Oceaniglobus trochenteri TaxID=2763260 RepID=UPI001CFF7040|nr:hypothetical protein [Oceaniglobus trochenteri]